MMRQRVHKSKQKREIRFAGICEAARFFGVGRDHLYRVLTGERRSPRIESSEFYKQMKEQQHEEIIHD